jgi:hypothetical protein
VQIKLIRDKLLNEYKDVFSPGNTLTILKGEPMRIELNENYTPYAVHAARPLIPYAYRDQVKKMT